MSGISKSREVVEKEQRAEQQAAVEQSHAVPASTPAHRPHHPHLSIPCLPHKHDTQDTSPPPVTSPPSGIGEPAETESVDKAPDPVLKTTNMEARPERGESGAYTLPILEEAAEDRSVGGRSGRSDAGSGGREIERTESRRDDYPDRPPPPTPPPERPPPTPPTLRDDYPTRPPPPTPPKDEPVRASSNESKKMEESWADTNTTATMWNGDESWEHGADEADAGVNSNGKLNGTLNGELPLRGKGSFDQEKALPTLPVERG